MNRSLLCLTLLAVLACLAAPSLAQPSSPRLDRIKSAGQVRVCIWPDYYGITFRNPKNGELSGIDEILSAQFARDLGVKVNYIDSSFPNFIADLLGDRCDVAMFGVAMLPERATRIRFSQPYLRSDIWAVTTKTHPSIHSWSDIDKAGHVVGVQSGTFMEPVMKNTLKFAELNLVKSPNTRERELQAGRIDVFMTDFPYSRRVLDNANWARVIAPERPLSPLGYAYAVAPGDDAWLARVDKFVADVKRDGRLLSAARAFNLDPIVITQ